MTVLLVIVYYNIFILCLLSDYLWGGPCLGDCELEYPLYDHATDVLMHLLMLCEKVVSTERVT